MSETEQYLALMQRYRNNHRLYIEENLKIETKEGGAMIPFHFNFPEAIVHKVYKEMQDAKQPIRIIVGKGRQHGVSTQAGSYLWTRSSIYTNIFSMIVSYHKEQVGKLLRKQELFYDNLPKELKPMRRLMNKNEILLENPILNNKGEDPGLQSYIQVVAEGEKVGFTIHNLHISELASFTRPEESFQAIVQGIDFSPNTLILIESTGSPVGHFFHRMWMDSKRGLNSYRPIFLPWFINEGYRLEVTDKEIEEIKKTMTEEENFLLFDLKLSFEQLKWRRRNIGDSCNGDPKVFRKWNPNTEEEMFASAGMSVFDEDALGLIGKSIVPPIFKGRWHKFLYQGKQGYEFIQDRNGVVRIWSNPRPEKHYLVGVDTATGSGRDYSTAVIFDTDMNQVLEYEDILPSDIFGEYVYILCKMYNDAFVNIELNGGHGYGVLNYLKNTAKYYNIATRPIYDHRSRIMGVKQGWITNPNNKETFVTDISQYVRSHSINITSEGLLSQIRSLRRETDGGYGATSGCHDDLYMAAALAISAIKYGNYKAMHKVGVEIMG